LQGKKDIIKGLKTIQGVNFQKIARDIDQSFETTGQTQTQLDFN